jgi:tetratricopeptide (TPR) repeat protein
LQPDRVIDLSIQICEGLSKAHEAGITHRDIKPSNIVIDADGRPKLLDFGLAVIQGSDKLTKTGSTLGTIGYMSPEQIQVKDVDHRSDLFSFGVVLFEMITGRLPFKGDTEASTLNSVLNDVPEPLSRYKSGVPDELQRTVSKLLEKDPQLRYQSAAGVISDLKLLRRDSGPVVSRQEKPRGRLRRFLVPAMMSIIVVLLLVLKPWQVEVQPTDAALAAENRLAVMYFDNLADPDDTQKMGEIATNLLITDLTESQYVDVVSSQRLYDILKLLGRENKKIIGRDVATEVARKAGSRWMLLGSILQIDPQIIITSQLVDVETGSSVASQKINGEEGDDIFALIDRLTVEIKNDLLLPEEALAETDRPVADVTTHSPEAYRYYLEGLDLNLRFYLAEAEARYLKALEFDSTFAMVYYRLSALKSGVERKQYAALALKYAEKANWEEQTIIRAWYARITGNYEEAIRLAKTILDRDPVNIAAWEAIGFMYSNDLQNMEEAIFHFQKIIEIDSLYEPVYNQLAYVYNTVNDFENAIQAINKYISLTPDDANPYDSRGEIYACNGKLDQAIESLKKAVEIKPDFYGSWETMGHMYLFKGEYDKARQCFETLLSSTNKITRLNGRVNLALIPMFQGKFKDALTVLDKGIAADEMEGLNKWIKHYHKGLIFAERGEYQNALNELKIATVNYAAFYPDYWVPFHVPSILILAKSGEYTMASEELAVWKLEIEEKERGHKGFYWLGAGSLEFGSGNFDTACEYFAKATGSVPTRIHAAYFEIHFMLARAFQEAGKPGEAVAEFESLLSNYTTGRAQSCIASVKLHYYLGVLYEQSGWNSKAIDQYDTFLDIWQDADPGIELVEDAKMRLARLQNKP